MLHKNCCNHPAEDFIESHAGCDIHVYTQFGERQYCVRYGSDGPEYSSSARTLDEARTRAETIRGEL